MPPSPRFYADLTQFARGREMTVAEARVIAQERYRRRLELLECLVEEVPEVPPSAPVASSPLKRAVDLN